MPRLYNKTKTHQTIDHSLLSHGWRSKCAYEMLLQGCVPIPYPSAAAALE